jgi:hypothetical protein
MHMRYWPDRPMTTGMTDGHPHYGSSGTYLPVKEFPPWQP